LCNFILVLFWGFLWSKHIMYDAALLIRDRRT
jgi:hypothetical protein